MAAAFGTSGLRGPADDFTLATCHAFVTAFLARVAGDSAGRTVYLGGDFRDSTPVIARYCVSAARAAGFEAIWAGNVPTPALAAFALARRLPAIMITGSHIPETYNGIKFYRPDGEFLKEDEAPVRDAAERLMAAPADVALVDLPEPDPEIATAYVERYRAFGNTALKGLRIGVDLHSAVGRDLTVAILEQLGAEILAFRRADRFIAVDTEALDPADIARARALIAEETLDCVVSTDGDGDRPLVIDETGAQVNGDVLGALTARHLGIGRVATPLSSTSAIEVSGWFSGVTRTRIGSPYVVAAMAAETVRPVVGFEANGGFLTGDDIELAHGTLKRLPTRDAILPMVATLAAAARAGKTVSELAAGLPARFMRADRAKHVAPEAAPPFLAAIRDDRAFRLAFDAAIADPVATSDLDGVRLEFADSSTVHFRQSGNAPEMRIYVETGDKARSEALLARLMARLNAHFHPQGLNA